MAGKFLFEENSFRTSTASLTGGGTVTVESDAYILASAGNGIALDAHAWTVTVDGTVRAPTSGILFASNLSGPPVPNSKLTIGEDGQAVGSGSGSGGVTMGMPVDIVNSGRISGEQYGVVAAFFGPTTSKGFTITNKAGAAIIGDIAIYDLQSGPALTVKNAGSIFSTLSTAITWAGAATITNEQYINGDLVSLSPSGTDICTIINKGSLDSDITLADGDDVLKNSGTINGSINLLAGDNKVTNSGTIYFSTVTAGAGDDTLMNSGSVNFPVDLGNGKNTVTNSGSLSTLILGTGNDTVTNSDILGAVALGDGDNKLTNTDTIGKVTFGIGNDTLSNTKAINGDVLMGDGANTVTNGGSIVHTLYLGSGNDVVKNSDYIGTTELGDGENTLTNSGTVNNVYGGSGSDLVKNTGVMLLVNLHGGDDTFIGGGKAESVVDEGGDDTYSLGGGDDMLFLAAGLDTCDGGAGFDYLVSGAASASLINLDGKAAVLGGTTLDAASLANASVSAVIKNFESASGTSQDDRINGNAAVNSLNGNNGNDFLAGGLGADRLSGGNGDDTFVYFQAKDSGAAKSARDTISDFAGAGAPGGDTIDVSAIDTNTKLANDQGFAWMGNNAAFLVDGTAQLRSATLGTDTIVQGDINGDGRADFSILVTGIQSFDVDDFAL